MSDYIYTGEGFHRNPQQPYAITPADQIPDGFGVTVFQCGRRVIVAIYRPRPLDGVTLAQAEADAAVECARWGGEATVYPITKAF